MERFWRSVRLAGSDSKSTRRLYEYAIRKFEETTRRKLEEMIGEALNAETVPEQNSILREHGDLIGGYVSGLMENGLSRKTLKSYTAPLTSAYSHNGLILKLTPIKVWTSTNIEPLTVQDIQRMLKVADTKDAFTVLALASSGLRVGELVQIRYGDIRADYESGTVQLAVTVRQMIAKGRYMSRTTFFNGETAEYLRIYLEHRRKGTLRRDGSGLAPEVLTEDSFILRNEHTPNGSPLTPHGVAQRIQSLLLKADLIKRPENGSSEGKEIRYKYSTHGLRRFFETQMINLGCSEKTVQHFMGHVSSLKDPYWHPTVSQLREQYTKANLRIFPDTVTTETLSSLEEEIRGKVRAEIEGEVAAGFKEALDRELKPQIDRINAMAEQIEAVNRETISRLPPNAQSEIRETIARRRAENKST